MNTRTFLLCNTIKTHPSERQTEQKEYRVLEKKNSNGGAHHGAGREVGPELGADDAGVAVRARDLAPDAADGGAVALGLGLVHVGDPLAAVPRHVLLGADALDLQHRRMLVLVRLGALVAQDRAPHVRPAGRKQNERRRRVRSDACLPRREGGGT